jgi:hypothetical protein
MREKFNKDIENLKTNQIEILKVKSSKNQIKNSVENVSSGL